MNDSGSAMNQLRAVISEFNSITADPGEFLASELKRRADSSYHIEMNADSDKKPSRGSGAGLSEKSSELSESELIKEETFDPVVEELWGVAKSGPVFEGNHAIKEKLLSEVLDPSSISVIPIVGMHGIGKTALARLVYDDEEVQRHFEVKAWVTVAGQEEDIARRLLKSAIGVICRLTSKAQLDEMVSDVLLSQRSLIVLDEVESINSESWMDMNQSWFRFVGMGSKIIITTCAEKVATIVSKKSPFKLEPLPDNHCLSLFSSISGHADQRLAARCNGLPLSLKLLGSLIRFEQSLLEDFSSSDSTSALDFTCVLYLSVLALPVDLFKCVAYCGIFPYGYGLEKEKLIRMWIADGAIKPSTKSMEDTGEAYFRQLLCRFFFTDVTCNEYGDVVQARMPRAIHELAQRMAEAVYREKVSLQTYNWRGVDDGTNYIKLKSLRSLDLSRSGIHSLPGFICKLIELEYLNLSHTFLTTLPESFTDLTLLQTLDLSECYLLKALPKKMSKLSQLTHLDLSNCNSLQYMPSEIACLHSLTTMPLYVLGENDIECAGLKQLGNLKELRGVLHIKNLQKVERNDAKVADLKHKKLLHLVLSWGTIVNNDDIVLEMLEPNSELKVLELRGYKLLLFPEWISCLRNLVKLFINDSKAARLPTLGNLPLLKELQIKGMSTITDIIPEFYGDDDATCFPSVEKLILRDMPMLKIWCDARLSVQCPTFPKLKRLWIQDCPRLISLPSLPSVKDLVVWTSNTKILQSLTTMTSLSSVVINNVYVNWYSPWLHSLISVKKLTVLGSYHPDFSSIMSKFTALEHLRMLDCLCHQKMVLSNPGSLQKLSIVGSEMLENFELSTENSILTELVLEDCRELKSIGNVASLASSIRKLIVRNCPLLSFSPEEINTLEGLELFHYVQ